MDMQAVIDAIAIFEQAQKQTCHEPGPGWAIARHARLRLTDELQVWLTGHKGGAA